MTSFFYFSFLKNNKNKNMQDSETQLVLPAILKGYRTATNANFAEWVIKACAADDSPPKAKHVRRIINAVIRDRLVTANSIANIIFADKPWRKSPYVGSKALYLVLTAIQYVPTVNYPDDLLKKCDAAVALYQNINFEQPGQSYSTIGQVIGSVIHSKLHLHKTFPKLLSNYTFPERTEINRKEVIEALRGFMTKITYEINNAINSTNEIYGCCVLLQPLIEEICNSYQLLKFIDKDGIAQTTIKDAEDIIQKAQTIPFVKSAIIYPPIDAVQPLAKFPGLSYIEARRNN